jgi:hypothetical protein
MKTINSTSSAVEIYRLGHRLRWIKQMHCEVERTHEYLGFPGSRDTKHLQKMALQYLFRSLKMISISHSP